MGSKSLRTRTYKHTIDTPLHKRWIHYYRLKGWNFPQIGDLLGVSSCRVEQVYHYSEEYIDDHRGIRYLIVLDYIRGAFLKELMQKYQVSRSYLNEIFSRRRDFIDRWRKCPELERYIKHIQEGTMIKRLASDQKYPRLDTDLKALRALVVRVMNYESRINKKKEGK